MTDSRDSANARAVSNASKNDNQTTLSVKDQIDALPERDRNKLLSELIEAAKRSDANDSDHDEILRRHGIQINNANKFNRRALLLGFLGITGVAVWDKVVGDTVDALLQKNEDGIALLPNPLTGACSFAGSGRRTPYDLAITNTLAEVISERYGPFGHCADQGGSRGNVLAALTPGYELSIAATQTDVLAGMRKVGLVDDLEVLIDEDDARFETALIATTDKDRFQNMSGVRSAIEAATPQNPIVISVPSANSGSYFTADNIIRMTLGDRYETLKNNVRFDHYSTTEDRINALLQGHAHITMSVQYPGRVDGELRSARAIIEADDSLHMVSITPDEFARFDSAAVYGYNLRRGEIRGQSVNMLAMGVVLVSRDPDTIKNTVQRQSARERNDDLVSHFRIHPEELHFEPDAARHFPVIARPEGQTAALENRNLTRRSMFMPRFG